MEQKKYWQSFGELNNSAAHQKNVQDEFKEDLPFEGLDVQGATTPRRDFLKYVGFSTAAAAIAASCETPVKKAIPFINRPADVIPGVAEYYATTYIAGGDAIPVIAKVRDGRPIKLEGNELASWTKGGTTAQVQSSVLELYDTARVRFPFADKKEVTTFEAFDKMVAGALSGLGGAPVVILSSTINSPSGRQVISEFLAKYPGSRHVQYDGVSYSGMLQANEATYGKRAIPDYQFGNAKVIVSLGADFLGTWLSPVEFQRGYTKGRKIDPANPSMSKHFQFESMLSMTGANADERFTHKPSETAAVAAGLLAAVNGQAVTNLKSDKLKKGIETVAKELAANKGAALVVSGSNDVNVQILVNAINEAVGANGTTVSWGTTNLTRAGIDSDMATFVNELNAGSIGAVIVIDANPAYNYYDAKKFTDGLKKTKVTIALTEKNDETTQLCKYHLPTHNFLESWGDAEPKSGFISLVQPTIAPLFKTRQWQESLLKWSGNTSSFAEYHKNFWTARLGGSDTFLKALQDGVIEAGTATTGTAAFNSAPVVAAVAAAVPAAVKTGVSGKSADVEVLLYQKVSVGDGRHANNPWLQEMPDPITRETWDNYVMMSPALGKALFGIDLDDAKQSDTYEAFPVKPSVTLKAGAQTITLPILLIPGMEENTVAIALGYGRAAEVGKAAANVGQNAFPLATFNGTTVLLQTAGQVTEAAVGAPHKIATTQTHSSYEGRHEVIKEITLNSYKKNPHQIIEARAKELEPWGGLEHYEKDGTIYPVFDKPGIKWGMSIDMNSCYGCGACVVACTAENNVAVVGKPEVLRAHDMHWLRIDRYFTGDIKDPESIQTVFQPMLCQHCDNAPCENVCPVAATNHSSEGLNQMTYNRCIGTRYCANNCPYKVRRFNWADYTGADSFKHNQDELNDVVLMMNDDLTRMVLNPDVTVRSRGVIEKCSFCVQRLQDGKLKAKKANRPLTDSDVKTACQQACAADAIVFGNVNNSQSEVSRTRKENELRLFYSLEQIHVMPNVNYLAKVRNTDRLNAAHGHEEAAPAAAEGAEHGAHH
ncbi:TAT-variant-translocated molybdopterin oxidoreductase [Flavihumibacter petaseus]|uniref:Putative polysulfide reductase iron-sulfur subunit n=1 Tax=Flavihumibacter petaseus NBRC 106054 TaxID=1220578 RepID=A0A0E9MWR4_9BACT|nr:TAT-variant-translocated molybdopterin oxidoreductase [Flavihumibacter petaseus]GAO42192.1 putative polysulfide reductase iron-sulfur subunit [Flavihumibacter petaseus NBRC 106054]